MKLTTHAAHHIRNLRQQQKPGEVLLTPCPRCGRSMPRTEPPAHVASCPGYHRITINSPESMGTRGHDDMIDA